MRINLYEVSDFSLEAALVTGQLLRFQEKLQVYHKQHSTVAVGALAERKAVRAQSSLFHSTCTSQKDERCQLRRDQQN